MRFCGPLFGKRGPSSLSGDGPGTAPGASGGWTRTPPCGAWRRSRTPTASTTRGAPSGSTVASISSSEVRVLGCHRCLSAHCGPLHHTPHSGTIVRSNHIPLTRTKANVVEGWVVWRAISLTKRGGRVGGGPSEGPVLVPFAPTAASRRQGRST